MAHFAAHFEIGCRDRQANAEFSAKLFHWPLPIPADGLHRSGIPEAKIVGPFETNVNTAVRESEEAALPSGRRI